MIKKFVTAAAMAALLAGPLSAQAGTPEAKNGLMLNFSHRPFPKQSRWQRWNGLLKQLSHSRVWKLMWFPKRLPPMSTSLKPLPKHLLRLPELKLITILLVKVMLLQQFPDMLRSQL